MRARHVTVIGLTLLAGACAQAMPGYVPPTAKTEKIKALTPKGGGFDANGTYHLTDQEKELDCKKLTGSIAIKIVQMRDAGNRVKPSAFATTAQKNIKAVYGGSGYGYDIETDLKNDRARLETLNATLAAKSCPTYDLDADLKPGNSAAPHPVKPQKK